MLNEVLQIKYTTSDGEAIRCTVGKWSFVDQADGEQYVSFSIDSEKQIHFAIGDYCEYRGLKYTLRQLPTVKQKAHPGEAGNAFVYDSVKMHSSRHELEDIIMLDVTPTTGEYNTAGGNYTGSASFQLFCGETVVNGKTRQPVQVLGDKILTNINRALGGGWSIVYNETDTKANTYGEEVSVLYSEEVVLSFDNTTVADAVKKIKSDFEIDYVIQDKVIYIGLPQEGIFPVYTWEGQQEKTVYGYGNGAIDGKLGQWRHLYEITRTPDANQRIITRLRALGSTRNLPYRYYNKKYSNIEPTIFPTNLQLPWTFEDPGTKHINSDRYAELLPVLGETNDAYLELGVEEKGLKEVSIKWDGSNPEFEEIYPTIEDTTYGELRAAGVEDLEGNTSGEDTEYFANYLDDEPLNTILQIVGPEPTWAGGESPGVDGNKQTNLGDGILADNTMSSQFKDRFDLPDGIGGSVPLDSDASIDDSHIGTYSFTFKDRLAGKQTISNGAGGNNVVVGIGVTFGKYNETYKGRLGGSYSVDVEAINKRGETTKVWRYWSKRREKEINGSENQYWLEIPIVDLPDTVSEGKTEDGQIDSIYINEQSDIRLTFKVHVSLLEITNANPGAADSDSNSQGQEGVNIGDQGRIDWFIGGWRNTPSGENKTPCLIINTADTAGTFMDTPFTVWIKDLGFDLTNSAMFGTDEAPKISMKTGACVAREFTIQDNPQKTTLAINNKVYHCWKLTLHRHQDSSIFTYYPNEYTPLIPGDKFVLLNIQLPEVYIRAAEIRLWKAASNYLKENNTARYSYTPNIDEIYIQREYDSHQDKTKSIYWKLYAGHKFTLHDVFDDEKGGKDVSIRISNVTIREGEGQIPKFDIKLSEEKHLSRIESISKQVSGVTTTIVSGVSNKANSGTIASSAKVNGPSRITATRAGESGSGVTTGDIEYKLEDYLSKQEASSTYLAQKTFDSLFIPEYDEAGVLQRIQAKADFYSIGGISAYGIGASGSPSNFHGILLPNNETRGVNAEGYIDLSDVSFGSGETSMGIQSIVLNGTALTGTSVAMQVATKVRLNGSEYNADTKGVIDLGTIQAPLVDLTDYLTKADAASTYLAQTTADGRYALKTELPDLSTYLTQARADELYLKVGDTLKWANVTGKPSWIGTSKPTYAVSEISGLQTALNGKADASALSALDTRVSNVANSLSNYVTIAGNETITGIKTFQATTYFKGGAIAMLDSNGYGLNLDQIYESSSNNKTIYLQRFNGGSFATHYIQFLGANANYGVKIGTDLRIGNAVISYDSANNALKVAHTNGGAMNLYATGGVSALSALFSGNDTLSDLVISNQLSVSERVNAKAIYANPTTSASDYELQLWGGSTQGSDSIRLNGNCVIDSDGWISAPYIRVENDDTYSLLQTPRLKLGTTTFNEISEMSGSKPSVNYSGYVYVTIDGYRYRISATRIQ